MMRSDRHEAERPEPGFQFLDAFGDDGLQGLIVLCSTLHVVFIVLEAATVMLPVVPFTPLKSTPLPQTLCSHLVLTRRHLLLAALPKAESALPTLVEGRFTAGVDEQVVDERAGETARDRGDPRRPEPVLVAERPDRPAVAERGSHETRTKVTRRAVKNHAQVNSIALVILEGATHLTAYAVCIPKHA